MSQTPSEVALPHPDRLLTALVEMGDAEFPRPAREQAFAIRRLQLFDERSPIPRTGIGEPVTTFVVHVHRDLIAAADREVDLAVGMGDLTENALVVERLVEALREVVGSVADETRPLFTIEPVWARAFGSIVAQLTGVAPDPATISAARKAQVYRIVDRFCGDPRLAPLSLAEAMGISRRALYDLTGSTLGGIGEYIRVARASRAVDMLRGRDGVPSIREVARRAGFSSSKHLTRALDSIYGLSPGAIRTSGEVVREVERNRDVA